MQSKRKLNWRQFVIATMHIFYSNKKNPKKNQLLQLSHRWLDGLKSLLGSLYLNRRHLWIFSSDSQTQEDRLPLEMWMDYCSIGCTQCRRFFSIVSAIYILNKKGDVELHNLLKELKCFCLLHAMVKHFVVLLLSKTQSVKFHYP